MLVLEKEKKKKVITGCCVGVGENLSDVAVTEFWGRGEKKKIVTIIEFCSQ